ncbi:hypothetical protein Xkoz_01911 [Xenorhabdus kozodoii]|uniref:Uncharacterized protein n=1 Tax=Xenorhabdus kozodoii TaxID=351676 RepID=A0A2D0LD25_9GAMM|nr:hypothetical protein Xkoz_01911 [Xenorhabdus kozodoii]
MKKPLGMINVTKTTLLIVKSKKDNKNINFQNSTEKIIIFFGAIFLTNLSDQWLPLGFQACPVQLRSL